MPNIDNAAAVKATLDFIDLPLGGSQLGIWLADQIAVQSNGYTVAHYTELRGALDAEILQRAIRIGLAGADTLHAQFIDGDDSPLQRLPSALNENDIALPETIDLRSDSDPLDAAKTWMTADLQQPLRADAPQLFRHALLRIGGQHWLWYQRYHHVCVDGYSFAAITRRIGAIYCALQTNTEIPANPFTSFAAVIDEENNYRASPFFQRDQQFWRDYVGRLATPCSLSIREASNAASFANVDVLRARIRFEPAAIEPLLDIINEHRVSIAELAMAGIAAYLQRMTQQRRQVVGVPFMRRMGSAAISAVGPVVTVLPLQLDVDPQQSLLGTTLQLTTELKRIRKHQRYDAEQLQRDSHLIGNGGRTPLLSRLYGPTLNLKIYDQTFDFGSDRDAVTGTHHLLAAGPVDDLEFGLWLEAGALTIELAANPARYTAAELTRHTERLDGFLRHALQRPGMPLAELTLISAAENAHLALWSQGPQLATAAEQTSILDAFQQHVTSQPNSVALICDLQELTYAELSARIAQLGRALLANDIGAGDIIAIALPRSLDNVVAIFAVLATGAAYLPLDLDYPSERLALMCDDATPVLAITCNWARARLPENMRCLCIDTATQIHAFSQYPSHPIADGERRKPQHADHLAYIIYTSGSTGTPKGVMVSHANLFNLLLSHRSSLYGAAIHHTQHNDRRLRAAHTTSFAFDASWEQLLWLMLGQELLICDEEQRRDAQALTDLVQRKNIDALDVPPALLQQLLACGLMDADRHHPTLILVGSEAVPSALWREIQRYRKLHVHNFYGPTEYTVDALGANVNIADEPVIGRPLANTRIYVLDRELREVPIGVTGELYISGAGLARGYLNRASMTASRFVANPFAIGERMYRSGDLVRWRADGELEFIGRTDQQIKVRGFRIELGEIEHALAALPGVTGALVIADKTEGSHRLFAYCTIDGSADTLDQSLSQKILERLAARLPDYMVPVALAVLPAWPLNINGKIDRQALPAIDTKPVTTSRAPNTGHERLLCASFAAVLNVREVGADDDFFALGGDSISAMALGTQLRRAGFLLRPRDVFAQRTPARMAAALEPLQAAPDAAIETLGAIGKLPIVSWFAERYGLERRYAQGVLIKVPAQVQVSHIAQALAALLRAHPILRAHTEQKTLVVKHTTAAIETATLIQSSISNVTLADGDALTRLADELFEVACAQLAPARGAMLQAVRIHGTQNYLLLAIHHLAVDGVSWRVLLPELESACLAAVAGTTPFIPSEETTLHGWAQMLAAAIPARRAELPLWRAMLEQSLPPLTRRALHPERDIYGTARHRRTLLDRELTSALLTTLPAAYRANVDEILLAIVALACRDQFDRQKFRFALESHGRGDFGDNQNSGSNRRGHIYDSVDLGRTVGWLTAEYPVQFDLSAVPFAGAGAAAVRAIKQSLRRIPDRGLGYGVLRYLDHGQVDNDTTDKGLAAKELVDKESSAALAQLEKENPCQLLFNYLGRFASAGSDNDDWKPQAIGGRFADSFAVDNDPSMPLVHPLEINIFVDETAAGPQLAINWTWADALFESDDIDGLHHDFATHAARLLHFAGQHPTLAAETLVAAEIQLASGARLSDVALQALRHRYGALSAVLPVLPLQEGLLFHAQLGVAASKYNSISRIDFVGPIDVEHLRDALDAVLRRHPQMGALFDIEGSGDGVPLQLLPLIHHRTEHRVRHWPWSTSSLADIPLDQHDARLWQLEHNELNREFSIGAADAGPLLHALLVERGNNRHALFLTAHHLVVDGWSTPILLRDLLRAYGDGVDTLQPTRVDYPTVVRALSQRDPEPARAAWRDALNGVKPTLVFGDAPAATNTDAGNISELELIVPAELEHALAARCRERGLTLNTIMQGAWGALLSIMTGRDDVVFGAPVSGRFSPVDGIDEHIGLFSNTIPVRVRLTPHKPLLDQLAALQAQQIELLEHDNLGLADIQHLVVADNSAPTLFDTLLVSENYPDDGALRSRDHRGAYIEGLRNRGYTHYPLTALVLPGAQLRVIIEYRDVVREPQQLAERLLLLLNHLAHAADRPWSAFEARTAAERALIDRVNATTRSVPVTTLRELMIAQAERTPDAPALEDDEHQLNYQQVRTQVVAMAERLTAAGVGRGDIVAIAMPRSARLSLALYATIEVGAAYLPLDTGYPDERLASMIGDAKPTLIVTTLALAERFAAMGQLLIFDRLSAEHAAQRTTTATVEIAADDAAYLLYTSGSTGKPKGVLVSHRAIVNRLLWMQHEYALAADDVVLQKTPCSFDVSVWEFFWPPIVGAKLLMAPPEAHRDPEQLLQLIAQHAVTTAHFVPSMLAAFVAEIEMDAVARGAQCNSLRRVFCSGEALARELADACARVIAAPLHNLYGPTEAAVDVTHKPAADDASTQLAGSVPIGLPVWNTQLRILDRWLRPVPVGVAGDLYLCGVQLAHGYLGRPDLTAARFVADPFAEPQHNPSAHGERMYRTGDIARWLPTGDVEYLGRSDDQLKIRGQRIELGEIEAALLARENIARAVVHARVLVNATPVTGSDARQLIAYVIAREAEVVIDSESLRTALAAILPAHMVPIAIVQLDAFPLSANGKLDRKALPEPVDVNGGSGRAPRPGLESRIASAFARLLDMPSVRADDDFFTLGGHSLLAMRLAAELRKELERPLSVGQIMVSPTVAKLAALLSDEATANDQTNAGFGEVLHLRGGRGRPLFCIHPASGFAWQYSGFSRYLPADLPLIGLQSPRPRGPIAAAADMDAMCEQHLATLRKLQPHGPYQLIGYSLGGTIAQGIAARLRALGEEVSFLGLFDTYPPEGQDWSGPTDTEARAEVDREQAQFMAATDEAEDEFVRCEKQLMFDQIVANYQDAVRILSAARTPVFDGTPVLFVATRTLPQGWNVRGSWAPYLTGLDVHEIDCAHEDILAPQALEILGPLLRELLERANAKSR